MYQAYSQSKSPRPIASFSPRQIVYEQKSVSRSIRYPPPISMMQNTQSPLGSPVGHRSPASSFRKDEKEKEKDEYHPLKIPADWDIARKHALARSVGKKIEGKQETCPCCGYDVHRELLDVVATTRQLSFLGSGFPLFYNFIKYCIFILLTYFTVKGGFNLITNLEGSACDGVTENQKGQTCPNDWIHQASLANKLNRPDLLAMGNNLNLLILILITILLFYFRKSQRVIDKEIDDEFTTPADYTLMVKNIPRGLKVDYREELKRIFTYYAIQDSEAKIVVTKVVLVYNIEELIKMEDELGEIVEKKQGLLIENKMNLKDPKVEKFNEKIEKFEEKIEKLKESIQHDGDKFSGIAFISFLTESMKEDVYESNSHTQSERIHAYINEGKSRNLTHKDLSWMDQKLFLEMAPEPNDIDWEFIHVSTGEKMISRIKSWSISIFFMGLCFSIIYALSAWSDKLNDMASEEAETSDNSTWKINFISGSISWVIVFFNKFIMGFTYHHIVDSERISSKTKFNIQFAFKLTIALFINTAMMSYIVDIVILGNIVTKGGFIQNETQVFILNALFPPFVWFIDPYNLLKKFQLKRELAKGKLSVVTQQQANFLMEHTEYYQAKRYADIMKTMWFTFLYGSCIPIGILFSIVGLSCYYWVDKYNVMRRRSVKENLAKEVSIEMIEMLELTVIFCGLGNMTMSYCFFGVLHWQDIVVISFGVFFAVIPMEEINDRVFQIEDHPETSEYTDVNHEFQTDYDRENPITRIKAIEEFRKYQETKK